MGGTIVVADTHFGVKKDCISMPGYFADFVKHIKTMKDEKIMTYDGTVNEKTLESPERIIFLGDIIELWDSENEAVNLCMSSLIPILSETKTEIVYILGNHDNIMHRALLSNQKEYYCLGNPTMCLVENVYPPEKFLSVGDQNYVFVHGHQFDKWFRRTGNFYKVFAPLRTLSTSLTLYIPALFGVSFVSLVVNQVAQRYFFLGDIRIFFLGDIRIVALLGLLTVPRFYMSIGRRIWNWLSGVKYKKQETIKNFTKWWKGIIKDRDMPENINVVYGHTHYLNFLLQEENIEKDREIAQFFNTLLDAWVREEQSFMAFYNETLKKEHIKEKPTLVNISSWTKDFKGEKSGKYKNVMVASFLYIDEQGFEFFGWDWDEKRIFHIPKIAIVQRRDSKCVDKKMAGILQELGWPEKLVAKWEKPFIL